MKKIVFLMASLAMLIACEKEEGGVQQPNTKVTIGVNQEQIVDAASRVAISENGNKFVLNWEGVEELLMTTSTSNAYTGTGNGLELTSYDGTSATFTGDLPNAGDVTVTNYYAGVSSFMSRSMSGRNHIRLAIATNQTMNGANVANSCMLVGEMKDCEVGTITDDFSLKTMNAFIKIPVKLGAPAAGATNTYANGMKLQSVKIEAVGGEQLSGRFAIDLEADDWSAAYATNTGLGADVKSSSVTLNCDNTVLTNEVVNLYVAVAFGTYAQGLKVTFNVIGDNDKVGVMEKAIKSSGLTLARNTMLSMPAIAVTPSDVLMDDVSTYEMITTVDDLQAGVDYFVGGSNTNGFWLFTGGVTGGSSSHAYTSLYNYDTTLCTLTTTADYTAAAVKLVAVSGVEDAYRITYVKSGVTYYLVATGAKSGKLASVEATDNASSYYWTLTDVTDGVKAMQGGKGLDDTEAPAAQLGVSATASSNCIRSGASTTSMNPLQFFKEK